MARLFISYKRNEQDYAFALRHWLMETEGWPDEDIFIDRTKLRAGNSWAELIFAEAEAAEVMLFLASEASLHPDSFCYRELRRAKGVTLAMTIKGIDPRDERLKRALPYGAAARQIASLDQQPTEPFAFVSPIDNTNGSANLNRRQVESLAQTLRELGVAPNSFSWTPTEAGPYPGLRPLQEGDEALFCGRDVEIRDGLRKMEELKESVTDRALIIQAPSGAGKSSFLRAGLWQRLSRHHGFTPLCIVRPAKGIITNRTWGLATGLFDKRANHLNLTRDEITQRVQADLHGLLAAIADADAHKDTTFDPAKVTRRTLLLGIDQAEEMTRLDVAEEEQLAHLLATAINAAKHPDNPLDVRIVLTVRDDSIDAVCDQLEIAGIAHDHIRDFRLRRLPSSRFRDIIIGPAKVANEAGWPLRIDAILDTALADAAAKNSGEIGDALPILALALQRLVANHRQPNGVITLAPEKAEDFLDDAVRDATDEALADANADTDTLRRLIIPQLATWDPRAGAEGAAKRQVASAATLFSGDRADLKPVADALVDRHLLTRSETDDGTFYEVSHEALLRVPPLGQLIYERRDRYIQAQMLDTEATDWERSERKDDLLARRGGRLALAQELLADDEFGPGLVNSTSLVPAYVSACAEIDAIEREREDRLRQAELEAAKEREAAAEKSARAAQKVALAARRTSRRTAIGLISSLILALIAGSFGWYALEQQKVAQHEATRAEQAASRAVTERNTALTTQSQFLSDLSRQQLAGGQNDAGTAMLLALEGLPDEAVGPNGQKLSDRPHKSEPEFALNQAFAARLERSVISGHTGAVLSVAFSPNGARILTGSKDKTARLWDATMGKELARLDDHTASVLSVAFSPDGARILTGSEDGTARLWNTATGKPLVRFKGHDGTVSSVAFSPDGAHILTGAYDRTARLWDAATGKELARLEGHTSRVYSVAFSPDGVRILTGSGDNTARLWDAATGKELAQLEGHTGAVYSVVFSPGGARILTSSGDKTARLWDTATGKELARLEGHTGAICSVAFSPDGLHLLTGSFDNTARLWDAATGKELARLKDHDYNVLSVAFSPDGARFLTGFSDNTARLWDAAVGKELAHFKGHTGAVYSVAFSPGGKRILTGSGDKTTRLWDAATGKELARLEGHTGAVCSVAFSPGGTRILTGSGDKTTRLWDAATGKELARLEGHTDPVYSVVFSPDGSRILTGSDDNTARLWDAATGKELRRFVGYTNSVYSVAFSPSGSRFLTGSSDETARLWDAITGEELARLEGHTGRVYSVAFSADRSRILTGSSDKTARLWSAVTGKELARLEGHDLAVLSVAFSPDGSRILTGSQDNTARLWDGDTGKELARLEGHTSAVWSVAFSPDGSRILTGSSDKTARLWAAPLHFPNLVDEAKKIAPRCLTQQQRKEFFLQPEPPRWCITGAGLEAETQPSKWKPLWPYHTKAWRDWLAAKDRGEKLPLPTE